MAKVNQQKTRPVMALAIEYYRLKKKLFGGDPFVVMDDSDADVKRYDQLFQFFHPEFRTKDWTSPIPVQP